MAAFQEHSLGTAGRGPALSGGHSCRPMVCARTADSRTGRAAHTCLLAARVWGCAGPEPVRGARERGPSAPGFQPPRSADPHHSCHDATPPFLRVSDWETCAGHTSPPPLSPPQRTAGLPLSRPAGLVTVFIKNLQGPESLLRGTCRLRVPGENVGTGQQPEAGVPGRGWGLAHPGASAAPPPASLQTDRAPGGGRTGLRHVRASEAAPMRHPLSLRIRADRVHANPAPLPCVEGAVSPEKVRGHWPWACGRRGSQGCRHAQEWISSMPPKTQREVMCPHRSWPPSTPGPSAHGRRVN